MNRLSKFKTTCAVVIAALSAGAAPRIVAQQQPVTLNIELVQEKQAKHSASNDSSDVVVWLKPLDTQPPVAPLRQPPQIVQRDKAFEPHLLVIPAGTAVQFPNKDPFFHNVFSLFDGKRFDLGLYEAGTSKPVHFDRVGVSFLFCNIHPEMSAVVVAVDGPYYAVSDKDGHVTLPNVPDGRYEIHVWFERSAPDDLKNLTRIVNISNSARTLGTIHVTENPNFSAAHKNKYGQDYVPPATSGYGHQ